MAFPHRPLPLLDEEDDIYYNHGNYFSDINFNFYTGYP
jgi:hypothetical protein